MAPPSQRRRLTVDNHDRDATAMRYVYAVVSRRAGGVSVGVNLNPNNACNWRCVYCQVEGLVRGKGPTIDLDVLGAELRELLGDIVNGDFLQRRAPEGARVLKDVAFSGNGEPTTSPSFAEAVELVAQVLAELDLVGSVPLTLITNGTMLRKPSVEAAIRRMSEVGGRVWFKLDRATAEGATSVNGQPVDIDHHLQRLRETAAICETWIQACMVAQGGKPPSDAELDAYLGRMAELVRDDAGVRGVLLYTLARQSHQPEAPTLSALSPDWMKRFGERIEQTGMAVQVA